MSEQQSLTYEQYMSQVEQGKMDALRGIQRSVSTIAQWVTFFAIMNILAVVLFAIALNN